MIALLLLAAAVLPTAAQAPAPPDEEARLRALFEREWEHRVAEDPLLATSVGRREGQGRLPSVAPADLERGAEFTREVLAELATIDREQLARETRVDLAVFERQLADRLAEHDFGAWQIPITADEGFHIDFARLPDDVPLRTLADHEAYLARLRAFPAYVAQEVANMRTGLARGMTLPAVVLEGYDVTIATHVVDDPTESLFFGPFEHLPSTIGDADRARLALEALDAVEHGAVAGYREFLRFFRDEYLPGARRTLGCSELPDGRAYYAYLVRHYTTLDLTPEEVHAIGLAEAARIRRDMDAVIAELGFEGTFEEFLAFLRTDPSFYAKTPHELLAEAAWICKRMDGALPSLFGTLPRLPYAVEPVPDHLAPKYTGGRYVPPAEGSTEPGIYWVNTYALESRPLYTLTALSLHEAVPGHHLQGQIARERTDQPPFRRYSYISAYGEGWGLYSEWLGVEAGMYDDPYDEFGRLTYEMWRACRLVVDTGLHAMGWTRERAMEYLASNTALSLHEVRTETDRYIAWPGQALAYKIGELEIRKLRAEAEAALGTDFDVRRFHDAVLATGSVPLPVLRSEIERFIEGEGPTRGSTRTGRAGSPTTKQE